METGQIPGMRAIATVAACLVVCACRGERGVASRPPKASLGVCFDKEPEHGLRCSPADVRRVGSTLFIRLGSGRELTFVDDSVGEAPGGTYYVGRIGSLPLHVLAFYGHEAPPTYFVMSGRDGRAITIGDNTPLFSPDSTSFAVDSPNWDNCTEDSGASLSVWRLTDSLPVREWGIDSGDCDQKRGWGATDLEWRSRDTLSFTENDLSHGEREQHETKRVLLVRDGATWRIVVAP
jgi:hypothetical protein